MALAWAITGVWAIAGAITGAEDPGVTAMDQVLDGEKAQVLKAANHHSAACPDGVVALHGKTVPGGMVHGVMVRGAMVPGKAVPGKAAPGMIPLGKVAPGVMVLGKVAPGMMVPGKAVPGKVVRVGEAKAQDTEVAQEMEAALVGAVKDRGWA